MQAVQYVISATFAMQPHAKEVFKGAENGGFTCFLFLDIFIETCLGKQLT